MSDLERKNIEKDLSGDISEQDPIPESRIGSPDGIIERIQMLIGDSSVNAKASAWGVSTATLSAMLKRGTDPSVRNALKIADAEGVSIEWLLAGSGPARLAKPEEVAKSRVPTNVAPVPMQQEVRSQSLAQIPDDFVMVNDMSAVEASAGGGAYVADENIAGSMAFRREWIEREGLNAQALRIIRARGDSMEPTIQDGAPILVEAFAYEDELGNIRYTRHGRTPEEVVKRDGVYIIQLHERLLVKRLQLDLRGGIIVVSDNPAYQSIRITSEELYDIAVVGRVVWTGRKL